LRSKVVNGRIVVENPNRKLSGLGFCRKGEHCELATKRYNEILRNQKIVVMESKDSRSMFAYSLICPIVIPLILIAAGEFAS